MNTARHSAEERLLEASLRSLLGRPAQPRPALAPASRWFAAACVLLGLGVLAATTWHARHDQPGAVTPLQEPTSAPLPLEQSSDLASLAQVPDDVENLSLLAPWPCDLAPLQRFRGLRRLQLLCNDPSEMRRLRADGRGVPSEVLTPLCTLPAFEVLELPSDFVLEPRHVAALQALPHLHTLKLYAGLAGDRALGDALAQLPALRSLAVFGSKLDAGFLAALAARPLQELSLSACPDLHAEIWRELARIRSLQRLEVTYLNNGTMIVDGTTCALGTLEQAAFDAFAALPELRTLQLDGSAFADGLMSLLPERLERLHLGDRPMTREVASTLRRLGNLRDLTFGCGLAPEDGIEVIGVLRLQRLDYRGVQVTPELLRAIAAQVDLTELSLKAQAPHLDFTPLAQARRLRSLQLIGGGAFRRPEGRLQSADELVPLRDCKALRVVHLLNCGLTVEPGWLGPQITVRTTEHF